MGQKRATRRESQSTTVLRERLLAGMLAAVNDDGYARASVANIIARAGVARATFYDHFTDKDDCFMALYREISRNLLDRIAHAVNASSPGRALQTVVRQITAHAEAEPARARFLADEAFAGGPSALNARGQTISEISDRVRAAHAIASPRTPSPDLPTQAVIGATQWLISQRMRRGERNLTPVSDELTEWLGRYERPINAHRWSSLEAGPLQVDGRLPALHSGRSNDNVQRQRSRILIATADSAMQNGYAASTVAEIVARAQLGKQVFYRHFSDKRQAFLAVHELAFEQSMAVGAAGYFSVQRWPERVWYCLLATSQFHAAYPAIAHVGFVEAHALGSPAIERVDDSRRAFTTLLRADRQKTGSPPSVTAAEAAAAAIFEIAHDRVRHRRAGDLPRYAYVATYLGLVPFLGVEAANRFVERKLKEAGHTPRSSTRWRRS